MKKMILAVVSLAAASCSLAQAVEKDKPLKVLMIGNSFSICNLREMPNVAAAMGRRLDLASLYIGGCSLERHWNNVAAVATNADFRPYRFDRIVDGSNVVEKARANIPDALVVDKWDVVTIQQASHFSWRADTFEPFGGSLVAKIRELAPQAKIVVQETWSYPPWDKRLAKFGFDQAEMYARLHIAYSTFAARYGFEVIPVGTAAEFVPDRNSLFTKPDFHFNKEGVYLQGLAFTAKLFGEDVRKCPYKPDWMSPVRAEEIKAAVMDAVEATDVRASSVTWDFPRLGSCHEGMAFADGVTGVLVWGGGDTVNLTLGRADLWDHRGGYPWTPEQSYTNIVAAVRSGNANRLYGLFKNEPPPGWGGRYNPYMLPLGRVVVKVPGRTLKRGTLDTQTGLGEIEFAEGGKISIAMSKKSRAFAMKFPEGVVYEVKSVPATEFKVWDVLKNRGFEKALVVNGEPVQNGGWFFWKLPADKAVWACWRADGSQMSLTTGRGDTVRDMKPEFDDCAAESVAYWKRFWSEGARVKVPDPVIQRVFDYGMYRFGAMTDPDGVPAGLQGPWLEDDRLVPWNGDYHFNINVQECYSPAYRGGHFNNLMPLFKMVLSWRPLLRDNARKFVGIDDGYVLPHSVDDRGVCIGGFWTGTIDHGSTAWVAAMMMKYVRYSRDVAFLKDGAYDFMKGAMRVYHAMMEDENGALSIPLGPSPEWGAADVSKAVGRDSSFQLAAAHRLARDLIEAAQLVGDTPDAMWLDVESRLPLYSAAAGGIELFKGQPFVESHRHHSHMAGLYPFDILDLSDKSVRDVVSKTYGTWVRMGTGLWSGWCVPWASILNTHVGNAAAAAELIRSWDAYFCNPGHGSLHDAFNPGFTVMMGRPTVMQMDGQCAAVTAVMEMMAHEVNGKVEFFKGCPESWRDVSFVNLALSDGRRVSGRRLDGKVMGIGE